jgi:hypothetical protein
MAKVLVINRSCHDFSPAEEYGEIVYMTEGTMERFSTTKMFRAFQPFIENSSPEDFILITGMTNMSVIVCSMFSHKHSRLNLLLYKEQKSGGRYIKRTLILDN